MPGPLIRIKNVKGKVIKYKYHRGKGKYVEYKPSLDRKRKHPGKMKHWSNRKKSRYRHTAD